MSNYIHQLLISFIIIFLIYPVNLLAFKAEEEQDLESLLKTKISRSELYNQKISETPNSIIIITQDEISLYGYQTVAELIATLQGMYTRNDLNYEFTGARGFDRTSSFSNNMVLLNGHILNELVYGSQSLDNYLGIDMNDISRVEIVQGPSSTLYGSGAMVSLINIILKDSKELNGLTAGLSYGTYDNKTAHLSYGKTIDDFSIILTGRIGDRQGKDFFFDEYKDSVSDGIARNLDWEKHYGSSLQANYKDFSLNFYYSNREKAIPNAPYESDFNTSPTKSQDIRSFLSLVYQLEIGSDKAIKAGVFFDAFDYNDVFQYDAEPLYDENIGRWFGTEVDLTWDLNPQNRLLAGSSITRISKLTSKLFDNTQVYSETDNPYNAASVYLQDNYQILRNFSINFGIRADFLSYYTPNYNPRVALIYNPTDNTTLKYLLNAGYRTPSIYELFADDPTFKRENKDIKSESLLSNEIIWENIVSENFNYTFSLYHYKFKNIIELASINPDFPDSGVVYRNINYFNSVGVETSFRGKQKFGLQWYLNLSYQLSTDSASEQITNSPQLLCKSGLGFSIIENVTFSLESRYESSRKTFYNTVTDDFFLVDANFGFSPKVSNSTSDLKFLNHLQFGLRIKNLFDKIYYLPGPDWISTTSIEQYGRVFTFSISAKL